MMNIRDEEPHEAAHRFRRVVLEVCMKHSTEHFRRNGQEGEDEGEDQDHHYTAVDDMDDGKRRM